MKKQIIKTEDKIRAEIMKLQEQRANDAIRIAILQSMLPQDEPRDKPADFVLTKALMKVLETHRGEPLTSKSIYEEIIRNHNGFKPPKGSFKSTLSTWVKENKAKKDERNGYMLA